jgi:predicted tellurium resistance membrane protein TerC
MDFIVPLIALASMEIVLGIDNLVFITIVTSRLESSSQPLARKLGLAVALVTRLLLLGLLYFLVNGEIAKTSIFSLTDIGVPNAIVESITRPDISEEIIEKLDESTVEKLHQKHFDEANGVSLKDLLLFLGGLFLVGKSVYEIHDEIGPGSEHATKPQANFTSAIVQIAIMDLVFSLDSIFTAVGMADNLWVMVAAIVIAVVVMLVFAEPVSRFVSAHPTIKMLALSFMILIGVMLIAEGVGAHIDKGYVYFAMFFALLVELLNIGLRKKETSDSHAPATG